MKNTILNLGKTLSKQQQQTINGGFVHFCQPGNHTFCIEIGDDYCDEQGVCRLNP